MSFFDGGEPRRVASRPRRFLGATWYGWLERLWIAVGIVAALVLLVLFVVALFASAWGPALAWLVISCVAFGVWLAIAGWAGF